MADVISQIQHPDHIWTWTSSLRGRRQGLWIPYLQSIEKIPKKPIWRINFNGGMVDVRLAEVDTIMLYGATGALPVAFLDELNENNICLLLHRRNIPRPYIFSPAVGSSDLDILGKQIPSRDNMATAAYVARSLIRERLHGLSDFVPISDTALRNLKSARSVDDVRSIEAAQTSRYWTAYFASIDCPDLQRRNCQHPVNMALDAGSFFMAGVVLRWALFHKLSPYHGYLHRPTNYIGLIYDLMEPYRHYMERAVRQAWISGAREAGALTAASIDSLKGILDESVYVPLTRQTVRRKSLLHGAVLSLRAWLLDEQTRFVIPVEGVRKGGRPVQVGFSIPGYPRQQ